MAISHTHTLGGMKKIIYLVLIAVALAFVSSADLRKKASRSFSVVVSGLDRLFWRGDHLEIRRVDGDNYDEVVQEPGRLVIAYFENEMTSVSKSKSASLDKKLKHLPAKVLLAKIQVDKNEELLKRLNIRTVPTFKIYREGELLKSFEGEIDERKLVSTIEGMLENWGQLGSDKPMKMDGLPEGIHVGK